MGTKNANLYGGVFTCNAHWSSSVQKVITPDNAIETGVKRFRQISKKIYENISGPFGCYGP
jgi:hypothetical protein